MMRIWRKYLHLFCIALITHISSSRKGWITPRRAETWFEKRSEKKRISLFSDSSSLHLSKWRMYHHPTQLKCLHSLHISALRIPPWFLGLPSTQLTPLPLWILWVFSVISSKAGEPGPSFWQTQVRTQQGRRILDVLPMCGDGAEGFQTSSQQILRKKRMAL